MMLVVSCWWMVPMMTEPMPTSPTRRRWQQQHVPQRLVGAAYHVSFWQTANESATASLRLLQISWSLGDFSANNAGMVPVSVPTVPTPACPLLTGAELICSASVGSVCGLPRASKPDQVIRGSRQRRHSVPKPAKKFVLTFPQQP